MAQRVVKYRVTIHRESTGLWAEIEDLPGCFASGETLEELHEAIAEAIAM